VPAPPPARRQLTCNWPSSPCPVYAWPVCNCTGQIITREAAEDMLRPTPVGTFLIRWSEKMGTFCVSFRYQPARAVDAPPPPHTCRAWDRVLVHDGEAMACLCLRVALCRDPATTPSGRIEHNLLFEVTKGASIPPQRTPSGSRSPMQPCHMSVALIVLVLRCPQTAYGVTRRWSNGPSGRPASSTGRCPSSSWTTRRGVA
jgi:hypothetical protein